MSNNKNLYLLYVDGEQIYTEAKSISEALKKVVTKLELIDDYDIEHIQRLSQSELIK